MKLPRPVIPTLVALAFFGGWEWLVSSGRVNDVLVPAPSQILQWFLEALKSGELLSATWVTMRRLIIGFAIGVSFIGPSALDSRHDRGTGLRVADAPFRLLGALGVVVVWHS